MIDWPLLLLVAWQSSILLMTSEGFMDASLLSFFLAPNASSFKINLHLAPSLARKML
jgi:hypothetical protein